MVGLLGILAGIVTFLWPGVTALVLVFFIGGWAIAHGIFEIIGAIQLRKEIDNEWWLILAGALSVIFGVMVLIAPGTGALALIWVIGAYASSLGRCWSGYRCGFANIATPRHRKIRASGRPSRKATYPSR